MEKRLSGFFSIADTDTVYLYFISMTFKMCCDVYFLQFNSEKSGHNEEKFDREIENTALSSCALNILTFRS